MKKRGFTLVEMLAVLVLIIALSLIIFPSIINYINSSKDDISDVTKEMILSSAKLYVSDNKSMFSEVVGNTYCLTVGDLVDKTYLDDTFKDAVSGEEVDRNQQIKVNFVYDSILGINTYEYELSNECVPSKILCQAVTELSTQKVYDKEISNDINALVEKQVGVLASDGNPYAYGVEYSCNLGDGVTRTFYVLEDGDTTTLTDGKVAQAGEVSLIASEDIGKSKWCSDETLCKTDGNWDNLKGPITANNYLISVTTGWTKLNSSQISLPSAYQIAQASNSTFNVGDSNFTANKDWLIANLDAFNDSGRYFTSSISFHSTDGSKEYACDVFMPIGGVCGFSYLTQSAGIRPVITLSKTQLQIIK